MPAASRLDFAMKYDFRHLGFRPATMDRRFRVVIPPAWRPDADEPLFLLLSRTHELPVLKVLTQKGYEEEVKRISESDASEGRKRLLQGALAMHCRCATLNDQGKVLLPKDLCEIRFCLLRPL